MQRPLAMIKYRAKLLSLLILGEALHSCLANPPCLTHQCPPYKYCSEKASGEAVCEDCDPACETCDGPLDISCVTCKIGYHPVAMGRLQKCARCPAGKFGVNCSRQCHCLPEKNCKNTNGVCLGSRCAHGYKGYPWCREPCDKGTWGLDCRYKCHCPVGDVCSHIQGDCSSRTCHPLWDGAGCQERLPELKLPPDVKNTACGKIDVSWEAFDDRKDIGVGPVGRYLVYKKLADLTIQHPATWEYVTGIDVLPNSLGRLHFTVEGNLMRESSYIFRVDCVGIAHNKYRRKSAPGTPSQVVRNECTGLPELELPPDVKNTACDKIDVSWEAFDDRSDVGLGPVGRYLIYKKLADITSPAPAPWELVTSIDVLPDSRGRMYFTVERDLLRDRSYVFRVDCVGVAYGNLRQEVAPGKPSYVVKNQCTV